MADCNSDALLANITADCEAFSRVGGVRPVIYAVRKAHIASMAVDATSSTLKTLALTATGKIFRLEGKKFKNTAGTGFSRSENGPNIFNQSVTFVAFINTQAQRNVIDAILKQDDWVIFVPTNGGQVKVYGYSLPPYSDLSNGLAATEGAESEGTAMADATSFTITFTGGEMNMPAIYSEGSFTATLDFLEALI